MKATSVDRDEGRGVDGHAEPMSRCDLADTESVLLPRGRLQRQIGEGQKSGAGIKPGRPSSGSADQGMQRGGLSVVYANTSAGHTCSVLAGGSRASLYGASAPAPGPRFTKPGTPPVIQGVTAGETALDMAGAGGWGDGRGVCEADAVQTEGDFGRPSPEPPGVQEGG